MFGWIMRMFSIRPYEPKYKEGQKVRVGEASLDFTWRSHNYDMVIVSVRAKHDRHVYWCTWMDDNNEPWAEPYYEHQLVAVDKENEK